MKSSENFLFNEQAQKHLHFVKNDSNAFWNFWKILHAFWKILHAFRNILEHFVCILEHSSFILEHSEAEFQLVHGQTDRQIDMH